MNLNTPFSVLADHSGADVDEFTLKIDGVQVQAKPVSALSGGVISFAMTAGLPRGQYSIQVGAKNVDGETLSAPIQLVVTGQPPAAVQNVRIVVI